MSNSENNFQCRPVFFSSRHLKCLCSASFKYKFNQLVSQPCSAPREIMCSNINQPELDCVDSWSKKSCLALVSCSPFNTFITPLFVCKEAVTERHVHSFLGTFQKLESTTWLYYWQTRSYWLKLPTEKNEGFLVLVSSVFLIIKCKLSCVLEF